jgi:hypothetical protein
MLFTEPPTPQPLPTRGRFMFSRQNFFGERKRQALLLSALILSGLAVSALAGLLAIQSDLAKPRLDVVMYVNQDSVAELFFADEFGLVSPENSLSVPTLRGANNLSFSLDDSVARASFLQRLDPCVCDTPVLFESISLASGFYAQKISPSQWSTGGDAEGLTVEGTSVILLTTPTLNDPQIFFYADIKKFADTAQLVAFSIVFALSSAVILFGVGVHGGIQVAYGSKRREDPPLLGTRRQRVESPVVPLSVVIVAGVIAIIALVQQFVGALSTGPTIDEPLHVKHLSQYFETGAYSSSAYGPVTALLGHSVSAFLGVEQWGFPGDSAEAYAHRHFVVAVIGLLGTAAVAGAAWLIFGSPRWAIVAAAFIGSFPLWVGHSMFNIKDIPLASGYALFTTGLIALFATRLSWWARFSVFVPTASLGIVIGLGTRPGGFPLFLLSALVAFFLWFLIRDSRFPAYLRVALVPGFGAISLVGIFLVARFTEFGRKIVAGVERSLDFPWSGLNLHAGRRADARPGVEGLAEVFLAYLPLVMTFFIVSGAVYGSFTLVRRLRHRVERTVFEPSFVLILTQAFAVFVVVAIFDPVIYDGGRQLLFIFPALALVAVFGLFGVMKALPFVMSSSRSSRRTVVVFVSLGLALITYDQLRLFPYNYAYYNALAQGPGVSGKWDTDYWYLGTKEAAQFVSPKDPTTCGRWEHLVLDIHQQPGPCEVLRPFTGVGAQAEQSVLGPREFWAIRSDREMAMDGPIFTGNCEFHSQVSRSLRGENVVMSRAYVCYDR